MKAASYTRHQTSSPRLFKAFVLHLLLSLTYRATPIEFSSRVVLDAPTATQSTGQLRSSRALQGGAPTPAPAAAAGDLCDAASKQTARFSSEGVAMQQIAIAMGL